MRREEEEGEEGGGEGGRKKDEPSPKAESGLTREGFLSSIFSSFFSQLFIVVLAVCPSPQSMFHRPARRLR